MALTPVLHAGSGGQDRHGPPLADTDMRSLNVLVFWSPYCGNCTQVLKELGRVQDRFAAAPVRFYSVNIDARDVPAPVRTTHALAARFAALDPADLLRRYEIAKVPWVLITQHDGRVVATPSMLNHPTAVPAYVEMEFIFRGLANPRGVEPGAGQVVATATNIRIAGPRQ